MRAQRRSVPVRGPACFLCAEDQADTRGLALCPGLRVSSGSVTGVLGHWLQAWLHSCALRSGRRAADGPGDPGGLRGTRGPGQRLSCFVASGPPFMPLKIVKDPKSAYFCGCIYPCTMLQLKTEKFQNAFFLQRW